MKFLVLLANGNETIEVFTFVDYMRRIGVDVHMVSTTGSVDLVTSHSIKYQADLLLEDIDPNTYDGLYIPGGTKGAETLRDDERVIDIVKDFDQKEKIIAAICAGPIVLDRAGVLVNKKATSHPSIKDDLKNLGEYVDDQIVVTDGHITTSRGAALTNYLALRIAQIVKGNEVSDELKIGIQQSSLEKFYGIEF